MELSLGTILIVIMVLLAAGFLRTFKKELTEPRNQTTKLKEDAMSELSTFKKYFINSGLSKADDLIALQAQSGWAFDNEASLNGLLIFEKNEKRRVFHKRGTSYDGVEVCLNNCEQN